MADIPGGAAAALYPDLRSDAAPVPERTPPAGDRSAAAAIYGDSPSDGFAKARAVIDSGKAGSSGQPAAKPGVAGMPGSARPSEQVPPTDWLRDALKDDAAAKEAPEPVASEVPSHLREQFDTLAGESQLSPDSSEKLLKMHEQALVETSTRYWDTQAENWAKQSRAQFGARLDGMVSTVRPLLNDLRLTPPAFRALLDQYRIGNHPVVIDTLSRWAAAVRRGR